MVALGSFFKQSFGLPKPGLTEENLPDQSGRVVIVTGGYAGVGKELAQILYARNATVYIAGRSTEKATKAIDAIKAKVTASGGKVEFLKLDLADLPSIKPAVNEFLTKESRLDVLVNNAGVMFPPGGSKTAQDHELTIGTNCLGHFLLTKLLTPTLQHTAAEAPANSVRVAWAGSLAVDLMSPRGGADFDKEGNLVVSSSNYTNYGTSKAGNLLLATEFARRHSKVSGGKEIMSVAFNPGNLETELQRHSPGIGQAVVKVALLYPAVYGAYTELWSGWSSDLTAQDNGTFVWPWGRRGPVRKDIQAELREGGKADKFWQWCEKETLPYA